MKNTHLAKAAFAQHFDKREVGETHPLRLDSLHISILPALGHCALNAAACGRGGRLVLLAK